MQQIKKMTDRQQAQLYFGLERDYRKYAALQNPPMTMQQIYDALYYGVYQSVNGTGSDLRTLHPDEQLKAYTILNTFFSATWQYRDNDQLVMSYMYKAPEIQLLPREHILIIQHQRYCCHDDYMFRMWLWSTLIHNSRPYGGSSYGHRHNTHHHPHANKKKSSESIALLILVALAAVTLALSFIAFYYLLRESVNSIERIVFKEGCWQSMVSLFSIAASGAASGILASAFAVEPLIGLALSAGLTNPFGVVIIGIICLTLLGAAAGCFITDQIQKHVIKTSNLDALDPVDPHRYALTDSEAHALYCKGIDPIKVKCAILALRAVIGDKPIAPLLGNPWNSRSREVQNSLNQIRDLRRGKGLPIVKVGDMHFDCRTDEAIFGERLGADFLPSVVGTERHNLCV